MKLEFFQVASPFLLVALSLILSACWVKILYVTIPAFVLCLYVYYPGTTLLQITAAIFWVLFVAGNSKIAAYSSPTPPFPKAMIALLVFLGCMGSGVCFYLAYQNGEIHTFRDVVETLLVSVGCGVMVGVFSRHFILYVLCPLIVLVKEEVHTSVLDYYRIMAPKTGAVHYVCFNDTPEAYNVPWLVFQRFRRSAGVPVCYKKRRHPLGLYSIGSIRIDTRFAGQPSKWETSHAVAKKKVALILVLVFVVFAVGALSFFLLVRVFAGM